MTGRVEQHPRRCATSWMTEHATVEVTGRVVPGALPRLRRLVAVSGQERVPVASTDEIELTVPFESEAWACTALLGLGSAVEVLGPEAVRRRVADEVRGAAAHYAG